MFTAASGGYSRLFRTVTVDIDNISPALILARAIGVSAIRISAWDCLALATLAAALLDRHPYPDTPVLRGNLAGFCKLNG